MTIHRAKKIKYKGITYPSITAAAKAFGMNESTLRTRLTKHGYTLKQAIETPIHAYKAQKRTKVIAKQESNDDSLVEMNKLWIKHQFKPNQNSSRGWLG